MDQTSTPKDIDSRSQQQLKGAIVVVAKCPIPGKSKTRLMPLLGPEGSVTLAKAMLADVLWTISKCKAFDTVHKILLYAPGNDEGRGIMTRLLDEWHLSVAAETDKEYKDASKWILLPMLQGDLQASDLGSKLECALKQARRKLGTHHHENSGVIFLGMDAPHLSLEDMASGLWNAHKQQAMLCPADDGGYGMLCVPPQADAHVTFSNLYWSHPLTAVSQIKALTDQGIMVTIGKVMHDIDDPEDVKALCRRLEESNTKEAKTKLRYPHCGSPDLPDFVKQIQSNHTTCHNTKKALKGAGLLDH